MKTRNIKIAGILLLGMLMVTGLNAQRPNQGGRGHGPYGGGEYGKTDRPAALDLSEEQQAEITTLRTKHYKAITPLKNKMAELKARERTLLSEESVDMKAVNKTIDEQTALANSIRKLQVEQQVAIKGLLTDEQVMKMQQHRQFARIDGYHGKSGSRGEGMGRGDGIDRGDGMGRGSRGYRGI